MKRCPVKESTHMADQEKIELFEEIPVPKAVRTLIVPTVLSSLVMVIYSLADTYFVGILNDPLENAAVTLAAPALLAFNAVNNLFGVGGSSMMSRALGVKDYTTVRKSAAFSFYCALFCGGLLSLCSGLFFVQLLNLLGADAQTLATTADYTKWAVVCGAVPSILNVVMAYMVRAEGASLHASIGTMSGCIMNMILDPIFILPWGLGMGAAGAGCATFLSNCVACCYFFILLFIKRKETYVSLRLKDFRPKKEIALGICSVGIPASIQNLLNVTGMTLLNNCMASYGADAVAAIGIAQKLYIVPMQISIGGGQGVMPLVGYNYASRNYKRMKAAISYVLRILVPIMLAAGVLYWIFAGNLVWLFMKDEVIIGYGTSFLRAYAFAMPCLSVDFLMVGIFQAQGKGKNALIFAIMRKIILEIPAILLLNTFFGVNGIAYSAFVAEVVLAMVGFILLAKMFRELQ